MRRLTRTQWIAALVSVVVLLSLAVAMAAAGRIGGDGDDFDVDSSEPSPGDRPPGEVTGDGGAGSSPGSANGSPPGGAGGAAGIPNPPPPAGPDTPVSSDDSPRPQPTVTSDPAPAFSGIRTFEDCAAAGYPVAASYPEQCRTPDGRLFVRVID